MQATLPDLVGEDGYFHIRFASQGWAAWASPDLPAMRFTVFDGGRWVDHQLLFHALQWPFTRVLDLVGAARASVAAFAGLATAVFAGLLHRRGVPGAVLWSVVLVAASSLLCWRLSMPRVQSLSLALLLLGLLLALEGRSRSLLAVGFLFAWTYHVCLLLIPTAAVAALVRRDWRPPVYAALGVGLGLAIHPQSPQTFQYLWLHVVLKVSNRQGLVTGTEWLPLPPLALARELAVPAVLTAVGMGALALWRRRRPAADTAAVLVLAAGALALASTAEKWVEYAVPALLLAAALAWRDAALPRWPLLLLLPLLPLRARHVHQGVRAQVPGTDRLAAVAAALPARDCRVFHANWGDWAELYFHAPQCRYVVGLDPHFLAVADPERARLLGAATWGQVAELGRMAEEAFDAEWVVTTHPMIAERAAADPRLRLVVQDEGAALWRVEPGPGEAADAP